MDSEIGIQIIILVILLFLSSFFSSAETALVSVNRIRLRSLADEGNKRAKQVLEIFENESKMLSAILIGNNLVNTFSASIAATIAYSFGGAAVSIATFIITLLILIFGEITPKTMATKNAEKMALSYAPIIALLMVVLTPVIFFINAISGLILKLFGVNINDSNPLMTENELRTIVDVSHEEGVIEEDEKNIIHNVFDFGDARAKDVMVPRVYVVMADVTTSKDELIHIFKEEQYTRIPIFDEEVDDVIGFINIKDLLFNNDIEDFQIRNYIRKPHFTFENKKISELMIEMKHSAFNMAFVMDEYGELAGIITLEDIIEELIGDVHDEYDENENDNIHQVNDTVYDVKGYINLHDLNDALDLNLDSEDFDSVGGLVIDKLGRMPRINDTVMLEDGIKIKVKELEKNRIEEVRIFLASKKDMTEN